MSLANCSETVLVRTRSTKPEAEWVRVFHSSIASNAASGCLIAITGPSPNTFRSLSVTMVAISMTLSISGINPVISMSTQTRL